MQQFAYTTGKNATDSALIIEAMDLLYTRKFDGFCLITSDSDFTGLAMRLREEGLTVLGFGEKKTPEPFVKACSQFIHTENLQTEPEEQAGKAVAVEKRSRNDLRGDTALVRLLRTAVEHASDDDGWAHLSKVANYISNNSSFSPINYGYRKLSDLLKASELFEVEMRNNNTAVYVKDAR